MGLGKFFTSVVTAWRREGGQLRQKTSQRTSERTSAAVFRSLTLRTSIFRPLSDDGPSGICRACTNASVNCCTTGKISALAAPYRRGETLHHFRKHPVQETLRRFLETSQPLSVTFSSSSIAQMRLAQVVNISTALDRVRML